MQIRINKKTNNAKIELSQDEEIRFLNIVSLSREYYKTKSIKAGCDCAEEVFKLFAKGNTNEN